MGFVCVRVSGTLMILKSACSNNPSYIDRLISVFMRSLQKMVREHLNQQSQAGAAEANTGNSLQLPVGKAQLSVWVMLFLDVGIGLRFETFSFQSVPKTKEDSDMVFNRKTRNRHAHDQIMRASQFWFCLQLVQVNWSCSAWTWWKPALLWWAWKWGRTSSKLFWHPSLRSQTMPKSSALWSKLWKSGWRTTLQWLPTR